MRAAVLPWLPALTETYGIKPWEIPRLSVAELNRYARDLNERAEAAARANAEANRRR